MNVNPVSREKTRPQNLAAAVFCVGAVYNARGRRIRTQFVICIDRVNNKMGKNKKVMCKVCYREMRSDNLNRHLKQHSEKDTNNPATNISMTNIYNTTSDVLAERMKLNTWHKLQLMKKHWRYLH